MGNSIKFRLTVMSFLQFFVWGAWLITIANYWFDTKQWDGGAFGAVFSTLGFSSLFMPAITGIIADKWINAERLYAILHFLGGITLCFIPFASNESEFFWVIFLAMVCYMPTISLSNTIGYHVLKNNNYDVVKVFPPIRVWGTVGFIAAMWFVNLTGNKASYNQFIISGIAGILLGLYSFTLPKCPPQLGKSEKKSFVEAFGLNAFKLFLNYKTALFFLFSMMLGAALQLTNMFGDVYVSEFGYFGKYQGSLIVEKSTIVMSISQVSETLFILAIPFFLKRFGIKKVMLISMLAWVLRFGLLAYGNPAEGLWMIILSCIVYGMAFDFFNVSGSLYLETTVNYKIRASAQGLFMMMTNGLGAVIGSLASAAIIQRFFTFEFTNASSLTKYLGVDESNPVFARLTKFVDISPTGEFSKAVTLRDWSPIWLSFAGYALVIAVLFAILFKHKHNPAELTEISH
ncbi:nucleoside permease [uncultured Fluviicola sp.]|uniref:nucleoside permease n=1 Tax=uncultured Fluviicola sp. TaxID=463303 RepID=UPI0025F2144D|nr:nucleoside permease [uncultured Fluviicola sp.]